jgi:hypothetical protein
MREPELFSNFIVFLKVKKFGASGMPEAHHAKVPIQLK